MIHVNGIVHMAPALGTRGAPRPLPVAKVASGKHHWKLTAFLTGLGSQLFVKLIGYLAFTEVFFLISLPMKLQAILAAVTRTPSATVFTILWVLWVIGSIMADVVNGSPFELLARGVSRSLFLGLDVVCLLALWLRKPEKIEYFMLAYPVSMFASKFAFKSGAEDFIGLDTTDFSNWKANTAYLVVGVLFAVVARYYKRFPLLIALGTAATGVFFSAMGSRAFGLTQILAAVLMIAFPGGGSGEASDMLAIVRKRRHLIFKIIVGSLLGLITIYATGKTYKAATRAGYLGVKELQKLEDQERSKGGVLVGGRFGFFVGVWAACHKPFLGHGSWPVDTYGYTGQVVDMFEIDTRDAHLMTKKLHWIPTHSAIIGAWVEHGLFGLLFWGFVVYLLLVNFPRASLVFPAYAGLSALVFSDLLWHVFFSPAGHRVILAAKIAFMLLVDEAWRRQTRSVRLESRNARLKPPSPQRLASEPGPA